MAHHLTQRGNYRQDVYNTDVDRRVYRAFLRVSAQQNDLAVSAYCSMTNHVHLAVEPEREELLAKAIGRTHLMYAQYPHRHHERLGHSGRAVFRGQPPE
ncbi:MAG: transposase [Candidatus Hydrogenedentes bacterium]|nr:transposase [Candidatus Hydrogenedentota bacterium]